MRARRTTSLLVLVALAVALPATARADDAPAAEQPAVRWDPSWQPFQPWQYVTTAAMLGGSLALRFLGPRPEARWDEGILFDDAFIDAFAVRSDPARERWVAVGDVAMYGALAWLTLDAAVVAAIARDAPYVGLQMGLIDLQSLSFVMAVLWTSQLIAGRRRPLELQCNDPEFAAIEPTCDPDDSERHRGFIAGHTAVTLAAAGLTCMHHGHMPLYGEPWDSIACGAGVALAAVNGASRIVTENHYATDLVLGIGLGAFAGWAIPAALHYGWSDGEPDTSEAGFSVAPMADGDRWGVTVRGEL